MSNNNVHGFPVPLVTLTNSPPQHATRPPCAACKQSRRRCEPGCVFAPVFPSNQSQKFMNVHRVYRMSNVGKLLAELQPHQRAIAVESLAYEAEMRLHNPTFGSVGIITLLRQHLQGLQLQLEDAKAELSRYQPISNEGLEHGAVGSGGMQEVMKDEANEHWKQKPMVMGLDGEAMMTVMQQGRDWNASAMRNNQSNGQFAGPSSARVDGNQEPLIG